MEGKEMTNIFKFLLQYRSLYRVLLWSMLIVYALALAFVSIFSLSYPRQLYFALNHWQRILIIWVVSIVIIILTTLVRGLLTLRMSKRLFRELNDWTLTTSEAFILETQIRKQLLNMNLIEPLILSKLRKAEALKRESRRMILLSTCTGFGAVISFLVGLLIKELTDKSDALAWGTVLSSFILIPASILIGFSIWDKIRIKWSVSKEIIYQLNFLESEYQRKVKLIKDSGMDTKQVKKLLEDLYRNYCESETQILKELRLRRNLPISKEYFLESEN